MQRLETAAVDAVQLNYNFVLSQQSACTCSKKTKLRQNKMNETVYCALLHFSQHMRTLQQNTSSLQLFNATFRFVINRKRSRQRPLSVVLFRFTVVLLHVWNPPQYNWRKGYFCAFSAHICKQLFCMSLYIVQYNKISYFIVVLPCFIFFCCTCGSVFRK